MVSVLAEKIPNLLYIPVAVLLPLGLYRIFSEAKELKKTKFFLIYTVWMIMFVSFGTIYRIPSSRYISILIPLVIPAAAFAITIPGIKYKRIIGFSMLLIVVFLCAGKALRPGNDFFIKGMDALKQDSRKNPETVVFLYHDGGNRLRVKYYAKMNNIVELDEPDLDNYRDLLRMLKHFPEQAYLITAERHYRSPSEIDRIVGNDAGKNFKIICQNYTDRHRKDRFLVIRKNAAPDEAAGSSTCGAELLQEGDCEKSSEVKNKIRQVFSHNPNADFFQRNGWDFPAGWSLDSCQTDSPAVAEKAIVKNRNGIDSAALHLATGKQIYCRTARKIEIKDSMTLSFDAKAEAGTKYIITLFLYKDGKRLKNCQYGFFYHSDDSWSRKEIIINPDDLPDADSCFIALRFISGDAYFDNFSLKKSAK